MLQSFLVRLAAVRNAFLRGTRRFGMALRSRPARELLVAVREPIAAVLIVFASTTALAQPFYVPSGSMEPTLQIGDAFIGSKYPYGYSRYSVPLSAPNARYATPVLRSVSTPPSTGLGPMSSHSRPGPPSGCCQCA